MRVSENRVVATMLVSMALVLGGFVLVPIGARAATTTTWTTTSDFDNGTKVDLGASYFAVNGVDQPTNFINYPNVAYGGGRTFVTWQGDENYSIYVTYYDHATGSWASSVRIVDGSTENPVTGDGHGAPSLLLDANGAVHVFCCSHDTPTQHYRSNAAYSISSWTELAEIGGTSGATTYPHPILIGDDIYLILRNGNALTSPYAIMRSTDNGATWSVPTNFIDFSASNYGIYMGSTDVLGSRVYLFFVAYKGAGGIRENAYVAWYDTATSKVMCFPNVDLGASMTKAEADASCLVDDTTTEPVLKQSNFGAVHVDAAGVAYALYKVHADVFSASLVRFVSWNGLSWDAPVDVVWSDSWMNYLDFIVDGSSGEPIEAFIATNTTGSPLYEGGDIERWLWNGVAWTYDRTVLRETSSGKPLTAPVVPTDHHDDFKFYFNQRHFDVQSDAGPANARLYAWGDSGFLANDDFTFGPASVETATESAAVPSGAFQLSSVRSDRFSTADADAITYNWGNATVPQYGGNSAIISSSTWVRTIANGQLNVSLDANGGNARYAAMSTWTIGSGALSDFDVSIRTYVATTPTPDFSGGVFLNVFNEPVVDGVAASSPTVDGVFYFVSAQGAIQPYTLTNGAETAIGTLDFVGVTPLWLRIARSGSTITWYYRNTDAGGWTTDSSMSFVTSVAMMVNVVVWNNDATNIQVGFDNYNVATTGPAAVQAFGFRPTGEWRSTPYDWQTTPEVPTNVTVTYSGASSTAFIDAVVVRNANTGAILFIDGTDRTTGTSFTVVIPTTDYDAVAGRDWLVGVVLSGDGTGSPSTESVTVDTAPPFSIDIVSVFGLATFIVLMVGGSAAISFWVLGRKRRGGGGV